MSHEAKLNFMFDVGRNKTLENMSYSDLKHEIWKLVKDALDDFMVGRDKDAYTYVERAYADYSEENKAKKVAEVEMRLALAQQIFENFSDRDLIVVDKVLYDLD